MTQFFDTWLNKPKKELEIANFVAGILLVCAMPFTSHRLPIFLNIWLGTWLLEGNFKAKFKANYSVQNRNLLILGVLFYFSYVFGLLFTPDVKLGLVDIVQKLSLLIAPIVLLGANERYYNKTHWILLSFAGANLVAGGVCLYLDYKELSLLPNFTRSVNWFKSVDSLYYTHLHFSRLIHPAYLGMFFLLSLVSLFHQSEVTKYSKKAVIPLQVVLSFFFLVFLHLLSSRANIIAGLAVFCFSIIVFLLKSNKKIKPILLFVILTFVIFKFTVKLNRLETISEAVHSVHKSNFNEKIKKIDIRVDIWTASMRAALKHPMSGSGTGNEKNMIADIAKIEKNGILLDSRFDAHNQYLQSYLGQGLLGLAMLLSLLFITFYNSIRKKNNLLFYISVILIVNFLFESVLQTISGITFFSFFLFLINFKSQKEVTVIDK